MSETRIKFTNFDNVTSEFNVTDSDNCRDCEHLGTDGDDEVCEKFGYGLEWKTEPGDYIPYPSKTDRCLKAWEKEANKNMNSLFTGLKLK